MSGPGDDTHHDLAHIFMRTCRKLETEGLIDHLPPEAREWWESHKALSERIKEIAAARRRTDPGQS